ncbi:MAG: DUF72 domain-containing protein [Planctomycetota bacterium]
MSAEVYVGPAGWAYDDWKGVVYPPVGGRGRGRKFDPLAYLARFFDVIEINSTFYRPPARAAVRSWAERVSDRPRFRFTVKVWSGFTHGELSGKDGAGEDEARLFVESLRPLAAEGRLGALLLQFPFWFRENRANRDRLSRLAEWLGGVAPMNVEIRHTSWLKPEPMTFLHETGLGFVNIDLPRSHDRGKTSPPPTDFATNEVGYVRLHGRNAAAWFAKGAGRDQKYDYRYSADEIEPWVRRVETIRGKTNVTYVIANNHFRGQAPANALEIMARIADLPAVRIPAPLAETYPDLTALGEVEEPNDGTLF